jgi:hypothetical protein
MSIKGLSIGLSLSILTLVAVGVPPAASGAHHDDREQSAKQKPHSGELVRIVREVTRRYHDVNQAEAEGYQLAFGCVSGPDDGAMGLHYVNMDLVGDGVLDPRRPEIVIYEPLPGGGRRLIGADYLVLSDAWHANNAGTPELMGHLLHLFESPNRFGLPAFYTLHVWAWKPNPTGAFVNWHSDVSCENYSATEK